MKRLLNRYRWFFQPLIFTLIYGLWVLAFRLITLTFITYYTISPSSRLQDISDAFGSNEVSLISLAALLFVGLLCRLSPLTSISISDVISKTRIQQDLFWGFLQGAIFSSILVLLFLFSGIYRYLGYYIQFNEAPVELANTLLRMIALGIFAYCEEFLFRNKILRYFDGHLPKLAQAQLIALLYCSIKLLQFDIGIMHLITLYLISIVLFYQAEKIGSFVKGAGFWGAILIVFHPLLSLPIFGNDFSGILLLKHQPLESVQSSSEQMILWLRLLTGGAGGPLASFAFQFLLILYIGHSILKQKKMI